MQATRAGWSEARRTWDDPAREIRNQGDYDHHPARYNRLWAYYNNSMFDQLAHPWMRKYLADYRLFPRTRYLYNPVERLVEFYTDAIYPGVLSEDGRNLPDGVSIAIPFSRDTQPNLKDAIAQFWQWSGWQANMYRMIEEAATLGNTLIEIIDDMERGKVCVDFIWPGYLHDIVLDSAGNLKSYTVEYPAHDRAGFYTYRKEVDQQAFRYYRDGEPYDYGSGAVAPNMYTFVPAVWVRHKPGPGYFGASVIGGIVPAIDELNALISQVHNHIRKVIESPGIVWSDNRIDLAAEGDTDRDRTNDDQSLLLLQGSSGGSFSPLAGNLDLAGADLSVARLYSEIERRHPEITFYEQLRSMSQVTGPAAQRLSGDVESRVLRAQASYDQSSMSLFRMAVAIGGMRANSGAWGPLNRQQAKFKPFGLDSYANGVLDMAIMPRPLINPTRLEGAQEKQAQWTGIGLAVTAGVPLAFAMREEGYTDEEIGSMNEDLAAKIQQDQMALNEDVVPAIGQ
jgi:hypothetical protein